MSVSSYKSLEEGRPHRSLYDMIFRNTRVDRFIDISIETLCILISMIFEAKLVSKGKY
ncbi:hypothetical protein H8356DRAFT_1338171 [Neocallimastix lanati (nom. inval.)]|nr:hypothetical protein H8356DRAFT_1338171 [Neocallimastix sp. JGI-2020a]